MAQIIQKFAKGGSYGTFTRNGVEYEIDDNALNIIAAESAPIADALRQGKDITTIIDQDGNVTVYGLDSETLKNNGLTDNNIEKLSRKQRLFENRKLKDIRRGYSAMKDLPLRKKQNTKNQEEGKKQLDMTDLLTLDYIKNEDGSISLGSSANNKRIKDRLNMYLNNLNGNWDEYLVYNTFADRDAANSYTNSIRSKINDDFWTRFNSGNLTEDDKSILKSYGIQVDKKEPTEEEVNKEQEELREKEFNKGGWDYSTYKDRFTYTDGEYKLNDDTLARLLGDSTGNLWLNDDFKSWATKKGYDASWIPQGSGLFRINGKWFLGNNLDALTGNERVVFNNWVNNNRETVGGSNDLIKQYWELVNPYHKASQVNGYSLSINPKDYYYDRSGQFKRESPSSPLVYDIVTPEMIKDTKNFNQFGHLLEGVADRIFIDPYTKQRYNYSIDMDPEEDLDIQNRYYSDENTNRQTAFSNYVTYGDNKGKLAVVQAWGDPESGTGWALLYNPDNKQYYWHNQNFRGEGQDLNTGIGNVSQSAIQIDPEMAKWIQNHIEELSTPKLAYYIDRIIGNPFLRNWSWKKDADTGDSIADYYNLNDLIKNYNSNGYTFYIDGRPVKFNFDNGGNKGLYGSGNMARRWGLVLDLDNSLEYRNGGVIKMQTGGVLYNTENKASKSSITPTSKPVRAAHHEKILGDGTELTSADWAEIGALIGDTASLGVSFIPGVGNMLAAGTGVASSAANLYSDIKRDGFDGKDVLNFGLNLALDLATLIPGLGTGAKAAKIAKALKKSKSLAKLIKVARGAGLAASGVGVMSAAVTSWDKLQNGDWTIKDIRNIVNGIRSYRNIGKLRNASVKGSPLEQTTLGKGNKKVTITRSELDDIRSKPKNEQVEAAKKLISSKLKISPVTADEAEVISKADDKIKALEQLLKKKGISLSQEETNSILNSTEGSLLERINKAIGEKTPEVNVSDYFPTGFSISSSGTWYKPWSYFGKNRVKDVDFGTKESDLNPEDANWWQYINGKRTAAIRRRQSSLTRTPIVFGTSLPILSPDKDPESPLINSSYYYPIYRKKGGKILKAYSGATFDYRKIQEEVNRRKLADKLGVSPVLEIPSNTLVDPFDMSGNIDLNQKLIESLSTNNAPRLTSQDYSNNLGAQSGIQIRQEGISSPLSKFSIKDPKKIVDFVRAWNAKDINKQLTDNILKGIRAAGIGSLKTSPVLKKEVLNLSTINRGTNDRINNAKFIKSFTSDAGTALREQLIRSNNIDNILRERNTEISNEINRVNSLNLDIENRQRLMNSEVSNQNRKAGGQEDLSRAQAINTGIKASRGGVDQQRLNQLSQDIVLDQYDRSRALMASQLINDQNNANNNYNQAYQEGINLYNSIYDKVKDNEDAKAKFIEKFGNSAEDYVQTALTPFKNTLIEWIQKRQATAAYDYSTPRALSKIDLISPSIPITSITWDDLINFNSTVPTSTKMKQGGSIQRHRPFNEQILLDNNKEVRKALSKMDDNLIKLLLKMLS